MWFQNRRSKWRRRENNNRHVQHEEQLRKGIETHLFNVYNTAKRSWPIPQAQNYCSCQLGGMFSIAAAAATLMSAGSGVSSRPITCASLHSAHVHSGCTGDDPKLVGPVSFKPKSDEQVPRCACHEERAKGVTNEAERSADELIGANGLLCMRGSSFSPFMSSN